mgnify:CR=1 FL=1
MEFKCCAKNSSEANNIASTHRFLRALADKNRLKILCLLRKGTKCACEIVPSVGISDKLASHHLKQLKRLGLLTDERRGNFIYYSLNQKIIGGYKQLFNKIIK